MSRLIRIWLVLSVSYAIGKFAVDLGVDGSVSSAISSWVAIPFITVLQAALLVVLSRRRGVAPGDES